MGQSCHACSMDTLSLFTLLFISALVQPGCNVFVNVINSASTLVHVFCLTFGLCLTSFSPTPHQHAPSPPVPHPPPPPPAPHPPPPPIHPHPSTSCLWSGTARPSRRLMFRTSLTVPRSHFDPFSEQRDGDLLKHAPAACCASTTAFISRRRLS